jgi:hypothetical protein
LVSLRSSLGKRHGVSDASFRAGAQDGIGKLHSIGDTVLSIASSHAGRRFG